MLGVSDGAKAAVLAALARDASQPILIITPKPQHAEALVDELRAWLGEHAGARAALPRARRAAVRAPRARPGRRRSAGSTCWMRWQLAPASGERGAPIVVACAAAIAQRTLTPDELARATVALDARRHDATGRPAARARRRRLSHRAAGDARRARRRGAAASSTCGRRPRSCRCASSCSATRSRASAPSTRRRSGRASCATSCASAPRASWSLDHARMQQLAEQHADRRACSGEQRDARSSATSRRCATGEPFAGDEFYTPFLARRERCSDAPAAPTASLLVDRRAGGRRGACSRSTTSRRTRRGASWSCAANCRTACRSRTSPGPSCAPRSRRCRSG